MPLLTHHDAEVDRLFRQTRLFLLGGGLLLVALVAAILLRQGLFSRTVAYYVRADSATEISKGMPIKVAGFIIGSVTEITLEPDASARVRLEVDPSYMPFIRRDSVALLGKEGLIGGSVFEIVSGNADSPQAAPQAQLIFARELGLAGIAQQLKDEIVPVVRDVKQITGTLSDPEHGIQPTLNNLKLASGELNRLLAQGNTQVAVLSGQVGETLKSTNENLQRMGKTLDTVNARLPKILDDAQTVSSATASNAPATLRDGRIIARDVREVMSGARRSWPLSSIAPALKQGEVPQDSEVMEAPRVKP